MAQNNVETTNDFADRLRAVIGGENVDTDDKLDLFSQDIYSKAPHKAEIVASPQNTGQLAAIVSLSAGEGRSVVPRGGGMSYTGGYLPTEPGAIMLDMTAMDRILEINEEDMIVTVEAGCRWATLYDALKEKNLRTPFWGPLSGLASTIGGGLSQNNAFFGAGIHGPVSDCVTSVKVVLADGAIIETGSASTRDATPFFRHYGPDLTGLFLGDTGALGVKAEASLRLMRMPATEAYASFSFKTRDETADALAEFSRSGVGCEVFAFDPGLQRVRMKRASLAQDVKALGGVIKNQKTLLSGIKEAAKVAMAGRDFVEEEEYSVHIVAEGRSEAAVTADIDAARAIAGRFGGREIENTIPKVIRGAPFAPLNAMIGPQGERWAPVHGIVAHSKAKITWAAIDAYFASLKEEFEREGVYTGYLLTTLSSNGFLIEPVFFWPEQLDLIHKATVDQATLSNITDFPKNDAASALVDKARKGVAQIFLDHGAAHFQIGKTYLYREGRKETAWKLLDAIKSSVDPKRRINPGALGLD